MDKGRTWRRTLPRIYLDGTLLDYEDTDRDATVGDLVEAVEKEIRGMKRLIRDMWADGRKVEHWRITDLPAKPLSEFEELKLLTDSYEAFGAHAVDTIQEYIGVIKTNIDTVVKMIRLGEGAVEEYLASIFDGLKEVSGTLNELSRYALSQSMDIFKEPPTGLYEPLLKHLEVLEDARSSGDPLLVADTLEYELRPFIEDMDKRLFHSSRA